jgi:hypothetical protein
MNIDLISNWLAKNSTEVQEKESFNEAVNILVGVLKKLPKFMHLVSTVKKQVYHPNEGYSLFFEVKIKTGNEKSKTISIVETENKDIGLSFIKSKELIHNYWSLANGKDFLSQSLIEYMLDRKPTKPNYDLSIESNRMILITPDAPLLETMSDLEIIEKLRKDLDDIGELSKLLELEEYKHIHAFSNTELCRALNSGSYNEDCFYYPLFSESKVTDSYLVPIREYVGSCNERDSLIIVQSSLDLDELPQYLANIEVLKILAKSYTSYKFFANNQKIEVQDFLSRNTEKHNIELYSEESSHFIHVDFSLGMKIKRLTIAENKMLENVVKHYN